MFQLISPPDVSCENRLFLKSEVTVPNVTQVSGKLIATFSFSLFGKFPRTPPAVVDLFVCAGLDLFGWDVLLYRSKQ